MNNLYRLQLLLWGLYFGYPICCILNFIHCACNEVPPGFIMELKFGRECIKQFGYIPCLVCVFKEPTEPAPKSWLYYPAEFITRLNRRVEGLKPLNLKQFRSRHQRCLK